MRNAETVLGVIREITAQITGEPREIERLTRGSEGGRWKSTHRGNSLAAYPTARPVRRGAGRKGGCADLARGLPYLLRRSGFRRRLKRGVRGCARGKTQEAGWSGRHAASCPSPSAARL